MNPADKFFVTYNAQGQTRTPAEQIRAHREVHNLCTCERKVSHYRRNGWLVCSTCDKAIG